MESVLVAGQSQQDRELIRRWVETWRRAGVELDRIRRREIQTLDTREAIRHLFSESLRFDTLPELTTSGLVEQQAWSAKLRR